MSFHTFIGAIALISLSTACILAPEGFDAERDRARDAAPTFEVPFEERELPPITDESDWRQLLQRAFLANGELEARWHEWRAALARVEVESAWPNSNVELGIEYMFSAENMKSWDRTTVAAGFSPDVMLALPSKVRVRGQAALAEAQAAGERFRAAKFALQTRFLDTWLDLAELLTETRLREEELALLRLSASASERGAVSGGNQRDWLGAQLAVKNAEDRIARLKAMCNRMCLDLHAQIGGDPAVSITGASEVPAMRSVPLSDAQIFALAAESNPELVELARAVEGRDDALELARLEYVPNLSPSAGFTGSVSQFLGLAISIPTNLPMIRAGVDAAREALAERQSMSRQKRTDVRAELASELLTLRDAERATNWLTREVLPLSERLSKSAESAYAIGGEPQKEWLAALRMTLDVRMAIAEARTTREKSVARLEQLIGVDFESLSKAAATAMTEVNHE
jgi:outer membrane protein, heavy metal efflux system